MVLSAPTFYVVEGSTVKRLIDSNKLNVFAAVAAAYCLHDSGDTLNPDSYFLRFPDKPSDRIIALPAHLGGTVQKSGIKWISSFPDNTSSNLARASAVLILNDAVTGYPLACIEASLISATRTAASAALAAENISCGARSGTLGVVGTGMIARTTIEWLLFRDWEFDEVRLFDVNHDEAERFSKWLQQKHGISTTVDGSLDGTVARSSLILFTTTASEPYLEDATLLKHCPSVLHLSLRDIAPNVILRSQNFVDDIEHCMKANTSLHLTETLVGNRDFVDGTLADVLKKKVEPDKRRARIFSPFGLGVLDLAVGNLVLESAKTSGESVAMPDFFSNSARW